MTDALEFARSCLAEVLAKLDNDSDEAENVRNVLDQLWGSCAPSMKLANATDIVHIREMEDDLPGATVLGRSLYSTPEASPMSPPVSLSVQEGQGEGVATHDPDCADPACRVCGDLENLMTEDDAVAEGL